MTEIAKYNGMMSYLTRPPVPKTQVADLVDDLEPGSLKDEMKGKFDPDQETYEEYLQRKGLGERPFNASITNITQFAYLISFLEKYAEARSTLSFILFFFLNPAVSIKSNL